MPKDLFAPAHPGTTRRGWTLIGSLIVHSALIIMLVGVSLSAALDGPQLLRRVDRFIMTAAPPEVPPPPAPPRPPHEPPITAANPDLAPLFAPDVLTPEPRGPVTAGLPAPIEVAAGAGLPAALGTGGATMSAPPPPIAEIRRVGGDIRPPQRLVYVPPIYPAIALAAKAQGTVELEATLDETGAVRDLKVTKSHPLFDRAAIEAVQKWRYSPTRLNGTPVPVILSITVRFALQ
jgi:protein TonB